MTYLLWLIKTKSHSEVYERTAINAIEFYLEGMEKEFYGVPRPKKPLQLPQSTGKTEHCTHCLKDKQYKPKRHLLEGVAGGVYSVRSMQNIFRKAKEQAGVMNKGGIYTLRHSYATYLLEGATDLLLIQELLGRHNIKTALRYMHVSVKSPQIAKSPLDTLDFE